MAVATEASETEQRVSTAYGSSILVMMASPFVLIAVIVLLAVFSARRSIRRANEREQNS
jgi:hypothetical protein